MTQEEMSRRKEERHKRSLVIGQSNIACAFSFISYIAMNEFQTYIVDATPFHVRLLITRVLLLLFHCNKHATARAVDYVNAFYGSFYLNRE
jgi:hypothetical protein